MSNEIARRIQQVVLEDRQTGVNNLIKVLRSDIYKIASSYLVGIQDIDISVQKHDSGIVLNISVQAGAVQEVGRLI